MIEDGAGRIADVKRRWPKNFRIVIHLRGPEEATVDVVAKLVKSHLFAGKIISVEDISDEPDAN